MKTREFVDQLDNFATSTPCVSLAMCTDYKEVSVPHLSIIDVRDLISGTKAELKKKKADDWTALVNSYESRELRRKASRFRYLEGKLVKVV